MFTPDGDNHDRPAGALGRAESWLQRRWRVVVALLLIAAAVVRIACFVELFHSPCLWLYRWKQADMNYFHHWAVTMVEGDIWSRSVGPPLHSWHREIAARFARLQPQRWAQFVEQNPEDPAAALWDHWCGGGRVYQGPLYPALAAGLYALVAPSPLVVYVAQNLAGLATLLLVVRIARRHFGHLAALVAALLVLLYATPTFYEFTLLRATWITLAGLIVVELADRARGDRRWWRWTIAGLAAGLAVVLKAHFGLLALLLVLLALRDGWAVGRRRAIGAAAAVVLGVALGWLPAAVRNVAAGAPPLSGATGGPVTFALSNAVDAGFASWDVPHTAEILARTDNAPLPTMTEALRTHPSVGHYLRLLASKLLATLYGFEEPNNANVYFARLYSHTLRSLPISFGLIGPLALVGLVLAWRERRRVGPLVALCATNLAVLLGFMVFARFRVPLAVAAAPLAGAGLVGLLSAAVQRRWRRVAACGALGGVLMVYTLSPAADLPAVRSADAQSGFEVYYDPIIRAALEQGDVGTALRYLDDCLAHQPAEVRRLTAPPAPRQVLLGNLAALYADVYRLGAQLYELSGNPQMARRYRQRADVLAPARAGEFIVLPQGPSQ